MAKKVLIISSSPRKGGNSDLLCDEFMKGAIEAGNEVEKIFLKDKTVHPCTGCSVCSMYGKPCPQKDDAAEIVEKMIAADLKAIPNQGQRLYELSFEAMLKARNVPLQEVNMWNGPLEAPRKGDLVLFNLKAFEDQFKGMWPMKNWEMLGQNHTLRVQKEWKEGWKLYVID